MMPLTFADAGEDYVVKRIGGKPEVKKHLENLGFVVGTETEEVQMPEDKSPVGSYLLIGLVAAGALGAGYYFKVYKPKHEYDDEDEYEDDETEEAEEPAETDDAEEETLPDEEDPEEVLEDEEES